MSEMFAGTQVNKGRQFEVDLAKALAIVFMIFVHVLEFVYPYVDMGLWTRYIIRFAGGPLAAPVFMTAMGIGLVYSKRQDPEYLVRRGLLLIALGYILNVLRGALPNIAAYMAFGDSAYMTYAWEDLICLDILQFAGLAFILFALFRYVHAKDVHIVLMAIVMLIIATFVPIMFEDSPIISAVVGYLFYQTDYTAFPLFSWFIYPVVGYVFGKALMRVTDKKGFYGLLILVSSILFVIYTAVITIAGYSLYDIILEEYYRQTIISVPWILLVCGMAYGVLYFVSLGMRTHSRKAVTFMSAGITAIYIVQWTIIAWLYTLWFDGVAMSTIEYLVLTSFITIVSIMIVYVWYTYSGRHTRGT